MDFVLSKLEDCLLMEDVGSLNHVQYLRARVDYCLMLLLSYSWKNLEIPYFNQEDRGQIISSLQGFGTGPLVRSICTLDLDKKFGKSVRKLFQDYATSRNREWGHGYQKESSLTKKLQDTYESFMNNIPILKEDRDIILINEKNDTGYTGFRIDKDGKPHRWDCPIEAFGESVDIFPRTFVLGKDGTYLRTSPFIHILGLNDILLFNSRQETTWQKGRKLEEGKIIFDDIFSTNGENRVERPLTDFADFLPSSYISLSLPNCRVGSHGTVMNSFEKNFTTYFLGGVEQEVIQFLNNKSAVTATLWGHGGVGKTACVQYVCDYYFNRETFSHIVFITAKDRIFNPISGRIDDVASTFERVQTYDEIIRLTHQILFSVSPQYDCDISEYEQNIVNFENGKVLLIIDDYETFNDNEKKKISDFLPRLDVNHHKVLITTRNKKFVMGSSIPTNEFTESETEKFLLNIVAEQYPSRVGDIEKLISDKNVMGKIQESTSGRPIFIYQFMFLFVQGRHKDTFVTDLCSTDSAKEFLYGRIYDYLSEDTKIIFAVLPMLSNKELQFPLSSLMESLKDFMPKKETIEEGLDELKNLRVIEEEDSIFRIYSPELMEIMNKKYNEYPDDFREMFMEAMERIGDVSDALLSSLLNEAEEYKKSGEKKQTIEKYRAILDRKNGSVDIRKTALLSLFAYLKRDNFSSAISAYEEYMGDFPDDGKIGSSYVYNLWSTKSDTTETVTSRRKAVDFVREYFVSDKYGSLSPGIIAAFSEDNLRFLGLGVAYSTKYLLEHQSYDDNGAELSELENLFNSFNKPLFEYAKVSSLDIKEKNARHDINNALLQTARLCVKLGGFSSKIEDVETRNSYIDTGLEICSYLEEWSISEEEKSGVVAIHDSLDNLFIWNNELPKYSENQIVNVTIIKTYERKAVVSFGIGLTGSVDISEIARHFVTDVRNELRVGDIHPAKILKIDSDRRKVTLSLRDTLSSDLWLQEAENYVEGQIVDVTITRTHEKYADVEFGTHLTGTIHISQIAKHYVADVSNELHKGESHRAKIIKIDLDKRRIDLSIRDISSQDLWLREVEMYNEGDIIEVTITEIQSRFARVSFGDMLNGRIHISEIAYHFVNDINDELYVGKIVRAKIIEINPDAKRIHLTLKGILNE